MFFYSCSLSSLNGGSILQFSVHFTKLYGFVECHLTLVIHEQAGSCLWFYCPALSTTWPTQSLARPLLAGFTPTSLFLTLAIGSKNHQAFNGLATSHVCCFAAKNGRLVHLKVSIATVYAALSANFCCLSPCTVFQIFDLNFLSSLFKLISLLENLLFTQVFLFSQ